MKGKPILHILYGYLINCGFCDQIIAKMNLKKIGEQILKNARQISVFGRQIFKGLTQNSTPKLKVEIQLYVDSENFMKKY